MSWSSRLSELKHTTILRPEDLDPVFISGSKHTCFRVLIELVSKYPWVDISNISVARLNKQYNGDFDKIHDFMKNNRVDSKIYTHCDIDLMIIHTASSRTTDAPGTIGQLDKIFDKCSKLIYGCDSYTPKTLFILDLRLKYFESLENVNDEIAYSSAALALIHKQHLFPFIEFVVVCDGGEADFPNDPATLNTDARRNIMHLQKKLKSARIAWSTDINIPKLLDIIMELHTIKPEIEIDLS